jgi:hypothetical protein
VEKIEEFYKNNTPIKEIMRITGLSKTSIYNHLRKLKVEIRPAGHSITKHLKCGYDEITNELSYIIGVMMGDGYISKGIVGMESVDEDFVLEFKRCMVKQFGLEGHTYRRNRNDLIDWRNGKTYKRKPTTEFRVISVLLVDFMRKTKNYDFINKLNREQKVYFIRGLWDSEGTVGYLWVKFSQKNRELCEIFNSILLEISGISSKITHLKQQDIYNSYFYDMGNISRFYDIIQPTIQRKRLIFEKIKSIND